ncbi:MULTISPECIES: ABC transporter permease [Arthrobacter]|uniref:ABC transporter permease n=2 Tax=Arthrobacter TaxID=1663 RepID=A0ABU9KJ30_9MICC|nr:ABC transporter permease [Arthrobacter sp. YJM1]MDP5226851.1 ABC transporter permease [Arthrobacter sp. YJM1]
MSTQTVNPAHAAASRRAAETGHWSFVGLLRSEWIKFWSLRSTLWLLVCTAVAAVGVGALTAWVRHTIFQQVLEQATKHGATPTGAQLEATVPPGSGIELYNMPNAGLQIAVLVLGSLAVLFLSSEYATGMIRSTMSATPTRLPVFGAKALILAVIGYVLATVTGAITFLITLAIFSDMPEFNLSWNTGGVLQGVFTGGLFVAAVAIMGLSLAALLKSSAGGVTVLIALMFVLDFAGGFIKLIPGDFWKYVPDYFPGSAGGRFLAIGHVDGMLDPWIGGLVLLGWVLLLAVPALIVLKKRDV